MQQQRSNANMEGGKAAILLDGEGAGARSLRLLAPVRFSLSLSGEGVYIRVVACIPAIYCRIRLQLFTYREPV